MGNDIKSWEAAARRGLLGPKHEIKALEGEHSFRARKYSVTAEGEIQALSQQTTTKIPREVIARLAQKMGSAKDVSTAELVQSLEPEDMAILLEASTSIIGKTDVIRLKLKYGIGEQDLEPGDVSDALIERILNYPELAAEMLQVIEDWNRPLPKASGATSQTSPSGSTSEAGSPRA